jgi:hypothetical protein
VSFIRKAESAECPPSLKFEGTEEHSPKSPSNLESRVQAAALNQWKELSQSHSLGKSVYGIDSDSSDDEKEITALTPQQALELGITLYQKLKALLLTINFYPNYEGEELHTIPIEEYAEFANKIIRVSWVVNGVSSGQTLDLTDLNNESRTFYSQLRDLLKANAVASRTQELQKWASNQGIDELERETEVARCQMHLDYLQNRNRTHYLEMLMQLLNLKGTPERDRNPTPKEQRAFRIISTAIQKLLPSS